PEIDYLQGRVIYPVIRDTHKTLLKGILAADVQLDRPLAKGLPFDPGDAVARCLIHMRDTFRVDRKIPVGDFIPRGLRQSPQAAQQGRAKQKGFHWSNERITP